MRHLYEYEDEEIKSMMTDLEGVGLGPLKGWLISLAIDGQGTSYLAITAENFKEAIYLFAKFLKDSLIFSKNILSVAGEAENFEDLIDRGSKSEEQTVVIARAWEGLIPKAKNPEFEEIDGLNVFYTLQELNSKFTNLESVLKSSRYGNL